MFRRRKKSQNWQDRNPRLYTTLPQQEKKGKKKIFSRFLFWLLLIFFAGVFTYVIFFSPQLEINKIVVQGNQSITSNEIEAATNGALNGKYLKYFSKRNFFFVRKNEVASALQSSFVRLEVSSLQKEFPDTLVVTVKERQPEIVWCSGGACYFIDKEGLAYAGVNSSSNNPEDSVNYLTVVDDNAKPVTIGQTQIDQKFVEYLKAIDAILIDDLKFNLADSYHTPALASGEVYAKIAEPDSDGWTLKLDNNISPDDTKKIIQTVMDKDINGDQLKNLDYLDLTVKGKVYYKMKN